MQKIEQFDWQKELNDKVVESLVKTFGIDWLLFEDKEGGNVDTIHNVRQEIWATDKEKIITRKKKIIMILKNITLIKIIKKEENQIKKNF